jgi:hypothetical protein
MTTEYPFSLAQLAQILSALENERRNPNTKRNAIKAIARNAAQIGLSAERRPLRLALCGSASWHSGIGCPSLASWRWPEEDCTSMVRRETAPCTFPSLRM